MMKKKKEKKRTIEPCGTMIDIKDYFHPLENIGVFPKPKKRKHNSNR